MVAVVARYHLQSPPEVSLVFSVLLLLGVNFSPQIRNFKQKEKSDISRAYADKMLSKLQIKKRNIGIGNRFSNGSLSTVRGTMCSSDVVVMAVVVVLL